MRNRRFPASALVRAALGLMLSVGMFTFLRPCMHADEGFATCHWAGRVLAALGIILAVQAAAGMFSGSARMRAGISLGMIPVAVLAALIPGFIIPLCAMETMRCNAIMKPASILIAALIGVLSAMDAIIQHNRVRREQRV